jgi:hypothetical protein
LFELKISETIEQEARISDNLIKEGFSHVLRAGELIQEVESILHSEGELEKWLEENCSEVDINLLNNCRKLYRGETVTIHVSSKEAENKEPQKRKR